VTLMASATGSIPILLFYFESKEEDDSFAKNYLNNSIIPRSKSCV
jgi:hypothetical protein